MKALVTNAEDWVTLAVTRSLGRHGAHVTASSYKAKTMTFHSRYCAARAYYPCTKNPDVRITDHLLKIVKRGKFDVFLPGQEDIVIPVSREKDRFTPYVGVPVPDFETIDQTDDKSKTNRAAEKAGLDVPRTLYMEDLDDVRSAVRDLKFPVRIKPYRGAGSAGQTVFNTPDGIEQVFKKTVSRYGPCMIQENITKKDRYSFSVIFDESHRPVRMCLYRIIREFPISGGPLISGITVRDEDMVEKGLRFYKRLKWFGMASMTLMTDADDGKPKFIEVNPRFFGGLYIPIKAGVDYPWVLARIGVGEKVKPDLRYKVGVVGKDIFPGHLRYMYSALRGEPRVKNMQKPNKLEVLKEILKVHESGLAHHTFALDDPVPALFNVSDYLYSGVTRRLSKVIGA